MKARAILMRMGVTPGVEGKGVQRAASAEDGAATGCCPILHSIVRQNAHIVESPDRQVPIVP